MGIDLLDTPVRITWDIPDDTTGQRLPCLSAIADRLVDGGVFFVTLQGRPLLHPSIGDVLANLESGCQVLLNTCGSSEELAGLARLPQFKGQLLLDACDFVDVVDGVDTKGLLTAVQSLRQMSYEPVLTLTPLRSNLCIIPDLMRFCREQEVAKFKLPNAHIGDSVHEYSAADLPRWKDLEIFRERWQEFVQEGCQLPATEIHDLFLWEIMTPGQQQNRSEYGGCQAGNSLGHIDRLGSVHPCAAWPLPLGQLPRQELADVWAGSERLSMRERVARTPAGCHGCADLDICFGGCRGLAAHLNRAAGERDLMCAGPR